MPMITIEGPENVSKEIKEELISEVSKVVSEKLNVPINVVNIVYHENNADNFGIGGKQLSELMK